MCLTRVTKIVIIAAATAVAAARHTFTLTHSRALPL